MDAQKVNTSFSNSASKIKFEYSWVPILLDSYMYGSPQTEGSTIRVGIALQSIQMTKC